MTIKIQGTIVSADYDDDIFASWIDKGIITPSSRVIASIDRANEPIDLYINSYGGDVFAGGEMMIALQKCVAEKKLRKCEVGSIAASMAANIVASLRAVGVEVVAHANSELMFHGCYTTTEGGAQFHEDVASSLRNINEAVIKNLNAIGITDCHAWFNEGREKWIGADEGVGMNLFTSIAEDEALVPVEMKHTAARLAAFASSIQSRMEYKMKLDETIKAEEPKTEEVVLASVETAPEAAPAVVEEDKKETPAETPAVEEEKKEEEAPAPAVEEPKTEEVPEAPEADIEARVAALANERFAGLQAKHDKMISDLTKERDLAQKDLADAKAEATSLNAEIEKLKADLAGLRDQLTKSEQNRESVVTAALAPSNVFDGDARAHLAKLPPSQREAFYKAHRDEIDGIK